MGEGVGRCLISPTLSFGEDALSSLRGFVSHKAVADGGLSGMLWHRRHLGFGAVKFELGFAVCAGVSLVVCVGV